jgi:hypothetical protein
MNGGDDERSAVAVLHVGGMHFGSDQQAAVAPTVEIMLHCRIRRKLARQLPPLAAGPHHIQQRIDDIARFSLRWPSQPVALR